MADRSILVKLLADVSDFNGKFEAAGKSAGDLADKVTKSTAAVGQVGRAATAGGMLISAGLGLAGKAAIDWESAWAGVTKTVDGSDAQLNALEGSLREMARTLPATHSEIAAVAEAAGQLGVKTEDVAGFTKVMIDLGETTNLTADEAATSLAQLMNVMGTSADDVERLGSTIVDLGNQGASTERDIVQMGQRIAAAGKSVGMSETQVLGFASALASVGVEAEAGGTAISASFKQIDKAARTGGESLDLIARTAGMSSAAFQKAWGEDAAGATAAFIEGLGRVQQSGGDANAILDELGMTGIRQSDSLMRLAQAGGLLADNLSNGASAWSENSALAEEAGKRYATTESQIKIAWNNIKDAAIEGGAVLLPMVADLAKGASGMAQAFAGLPDPVKATGVQLAAVAAGSLLAFGGVSKLVTTGLELRSAFKELAAISPGLANGLSTAGKSAAAAAVGLLAMGAAVSAIQSNAMAALPTVGDLAVALGRLGGSGDLGSLDSAFAGLEGRAGSLSEALAYVGARADGSSAGFLKALDSVDALASGLIGAKSDSEGVRDAFGQLDAALVQMDPASAATAFEQIAGRADELGVSVETLAQLFPQYAARLQDAARASGEAKTGAEALAGAQDALAADTKSATDALRDQANLLLAQSGSMIGLEAAIDAATDSLKENGATLDISTEKGRANQSALNDVASSALSVRDAQKQAGASTAEMDATTVKARASLIAAAVSMGMSAQKAGELATQYGLIPEDVVTEISTPGATISKQQAEDLTAQIAKIPPEKRADIITIANTQGAAAAQAAIDAVNGKTVTVTVRQVWVQVGGPIKASAVADGGIFAGVGGGVVQAFAAGGFAGSIGAQQPQIRPAGGKGILWAEDGAGPWESFISGHPAKRGRSRKIAETTVGMLGGVVAWERYADGGVRYSAAPSSSTSTTSLISRADLDYLADRLAMHEVRITGVKQMGDSLADVAAGQILRAVRTGV